MVFWLCLQRCKNNCRSVCVLSCVGAQRVCSSTAARSTCCQRLDIRWRLSSSSATLVCWGCCRILNICLSIPFIHWVALCRQWMFCLSPMMLFFFNHWLLRFFSWLHCIPIVNAFHFYFLSIQSISMLLCFLKVVTSSLYLLSDIYVPDSCLEDVWNEADDTSSEEVCTCDLMAGLVCFVRRLPVYHQSVRLCVNGDTCHGSFGCFSSTASTR